MDEVKFFEDTANKTADELKEFYSEVYWPMCNKFREAIRKYFSRQLMDTSEEKPLECDISFEPDNTFALSSLEMPSIIQMYQDPSDGDIWFQESYIDIYSEFDDYSIDELVSIMNGFEIYEKTE